jgi:hypothetical protein
LREEHIKPIKIMLDSGREVTIESFSLRNTYGGTMFGSGGPDDESLNNLIFEKANYPGFWGTDAILKLKPSEEEFEEGFKPYQFSVSLRSTPIDPHYCASELVVIWFDFDPGSSIENFVHSCIKSLDWEAYARDFDF